MDEIVSLDLTGTPYEQGVQQGKILFEEIRNNVNNAKSLLGNAAEQSSYKWFLENNLAYLSASFPELIEEMKGISVGSEIPFIDIVQLNIPAYFLSDQFIQECSMILARGNATEDRKTYIVKNRDMRAPIKQVLLKRKYPNGQVISEISGIGTVTYPASGLNSYGLGVTTTGFWSSKVIPDINLADKSQVFFNIHILLKQCRNVDEAVLLLEKLPVMNGLNLILADCDKACVAEMTKDKMVVTWDEEDGLLYRTNHYVTDELRKLNPDVTEYPSTFTRYQRIDALLHQLYGHIRFQDLLRILSDHHDGINGICRHPEGAITAQTVSTTFIVVEDGELWTTLTNPCKAIPHMSL